MKAWIIISKDPVIIGVIINSKEYPPTSTIIGLPPAGGCVTLHAIIKNIPNPTANGITI